MPSPQREASMLDENVRRALPRCIEDVEIKPHGFSLRADTAKITTVEHSEKVSYFLKVCTGTLGKVAVESEYRAMAAMYAVAPQFVARPIAWGSYASNPQAHFFLASFHDMTGDLPDIRSFATHLAQLHRKGTSTTGKYGFDIVTFHGNVPMEHHGWSNTWEQYFTKSISSLILLEQESRGLNRDILCLTEDFLKIVVPRLLRPLEVGNNPIRPSLIHGDLWHGNATTDRKTEHPIVFDAACFYAHNECDLAAWREPWNKLAGAYTDAYHALVPKSYPEEDYDDRQSTYAIRFAILDSILHKADPTYRVKFVSNMKRLLRKHPRGLDGWNPNVEKLLPSKVAIRRAEATDLDAITEIGIAALAHDPQWTYRFPKAQVFPKQHREFSRKRFSQYLDSQEAGIIDIFLAGLTTSGTGRVIEPVAMAMWQKTGTHVSLGSVANNVIPSERLGHLQDSFERPDGDEGRMRAFRKEMGRAKKELFDRAYGNKQLYLMILATHPNSWGHGLGRELCLQGLYAADEQNVAVTLIASPLGESTYSCLGFRELGRVHVQLPEESDHLDLPAMVHEPESWGVRKER